jgi:ribosomal protein L11 methyltransferase
MCVRDSNTSQIDPGALIEHRDKRLDTHTSANPHPVPLSRPKRAYSGTGIEIGWCCKAERLQLQSTGMTNPVHDNDRLFLLRADTSRDAVPALEEAITEIGSSPVIWINEETGAATIEEYFTTEQEAQIRREAWLALLADPLLQAVLNRQTPTLSLRPLASRDWKEEWKRFFHAERVSDRIVIKPPWEAFSARPEDCVLEIEPGMSFGTGLHPTTRACLRRMDRLASEGHTGRFLDLGCGSGILSIAAVKLGFHDVTAIDHDTGTESVVAENSRRNGIAGQINARVCTLAEFRSAEPFDTVAANLLADILQQHAPLIANCVKPAPLSRLLVAGTLSTQYSATLQQFQDAGMIEVDHDTAGEWTSGCLRPAD